MSKIEHLGTLICSISSNIDQILSIFVAKVDLGDDILGNTDLFWEMSTSETGSGRIWQSGALDRYQIRENVRFLGFLGFSQKCQNVTFGQVWDLGFFPFSEHGFSENPGSRGLFRRI